jgi:type II secretory pathway component PulF
MLERMTSYAYTAVDATGSELTGEITAPDVPAACDELHLRGLVATALAAKDSAAKGESGAPVVWKVYAVLMLAVGLFLLAVLLMAAGVVDTPHT